jgi:hypothetical protein
MREFAKVSFVAATASDPGRGDERADASEWDKRKGEVERDQWFFFSSGGRELKRCASVDTPYARSTVRGLRSPPVIAWCDWLGGWMNSDEMGLFYFLLCLVGSWLSETNIKKNRISLSFKKSRMSTFHFIKHIN